MRLRTSAQAHEAVKAANTATGSIAALNIVKPLTPEEALKANEQRPFDTAPDTPASQFRLTTDDGSRERAVECLTQAVYYEAATEGADGQRAVAQVVLNRMRHPGFPSTVCGVVYQGSNLPTGCQFTFTCDGSLMRNPIPSIWAQAKKIASQALEGKVFAAVGHATHYHADYVLPYWADSLAKQVQIGHHIFYRLQGGLGTRAAFSQRYGGKEPLLPTAPSTASVAAEAVDKAQALLTSGLAEPSPLAADAAGIAGGNGQPQAGPPRRCEQGHAPDRPRHRSAAPSPSAARREDCSAPSEKQIRPVTPADMHAG